VPSLPSTDLIGQDVLTSQTLSSSGRGCVGDHRTLSRNTCPQQLGTPTSCRPPSWLALVQYEYERVYLPRSPAVQIHTFTHHKQQSYSLTLEKDLEPCDNRISSNSKPPPSPTKFNRVTNAKTKVLSFNFES
jgi:hypothetical protein